MKQIFKLPNFKDQILYFIGVLIFLLVLVNLKTSSAQNLTPYSSIVCSGNTKVLTLYGSSADTINWETSLDTINWSALFDTGFQLTTPPIIVHTFFRAKITLMGAILISNVVFVDTASTPVIAFSNIGATHITVNWSPPGGGGYLIAWSGAGSGSQPNVTPPINLIGLIPCTQLNVIVSLTGSCPGVASGTASVITMSNNILNTTVTNASCANNDGAIDLTVATGIPISYLWSNGETTEDISNLVAGNYTVTVNYVGGCYNTATVIINNSNGPIITASTSNSTCYSANGVIDLTITGGALPYNYNWSNGATTEDQTNLIHGLYSVTVSDQNNCMNNYQHYIFDSSYAYYVFITSIIPNCTNNGALTANVNGGNPPFNYLWNNGETTQTISNLSGGIYSVTVIDNGGCQIVVHNYQLNMTNYNIISGKIYFDLNNNCVFDAGEFPVSGGFIEAQETSYSGSNYGYNYGYSDANGDYSIQISDTGNYNLNAYANPGCGTIQSCFSGNVNFNSICNTVTGKDFAFIGTAGYDFEIFPYCYTANPGFDKHYLIAAYDNNYPSYSDTITVIFAYDTNLVYSYSVGLQPINDSINHTLTWKVLNANSNGFFDCYMHVPATLLPTSLLESTFSVFPTSNDCNVSNNSYYSLEQVIGAYDPNEKTVTPSGNITVGDSILTYTIHFQNTGSDTTHFVIVKDTLSQYLNPASVVNLSSSAPFDFTISGNGILTWVFNPLFLPDSASNEAASKGFITFKIKVKHNLSAGTLIQNKASIYFDYNSPVVTNTVQNSIINSVNEINDGNSVTVYPNPFESQLTVYIRHLEGSMIVISDVVGKEIFHSKNNLNSKIINLNSIAPGIYFLKVISADGRVEVKKIVKE